MILRSIKLFYTINKLVLEFLQLPLSSSRRTGIHKNKYPWVYFFSLLFLLTLNLNAKNIRSVFKLGHKYVYLQDVADYYAFSLSQNKEYATLKSKYSKIKFVFDSRAGYINGVKVYFSFAPFYNEGKPLISEKDLLLFIDPILRKKPLKKCSVKTIVIDPGHGGHDNGAARSGIKEKNIVLSISRKLAAILSEKGYKIVMTRNRDTFIPLKDRPKVIDKFGGDLFVSIHCNAATTDVNGIETYIFAPPGTSSTHSSTTSAKIENGNLNDKNNTRLGYEIQKSLKKTGRDDRGLKHARFAVLRYSRKPAVLIETGFLSDAHERRLLQSTSYQNQVAGLIANGILNYINAVR